MHFPPCDVMVLIVCYIIYSTTVKNIKAARCPYSFYFSMLKLTSRRVLWHIVGS